MLTTYVIVAVVAYLLGSIPFGYILVKLFLKQDIRQTGSGNIGATNVARSGAKGLAVTTLVLDAVKGAAAVVWFTVATILIAGGTVDYVRPTPSWVHLSPFVAAIAAICGHMFPVWLKFRGGKGVATAVGAYFALAPYAVMVCVVLFGLVLLATRFVSLGSIIAAGAFPIAAYFVGDPLRDPIALSLVSASSALIIAKHHANIRRLLNGTEHKFGAPKVPADPIQAEKNA